MKFIKDKLPLLISFLASGFLIWFAYGCEPKTKSLLDPSAKVSHNELISELELLKFRYNTRVEDLQEQQKWRDFVLNQAFVVTQTGSVNPLGIATAIMALLGIGAGVDDVRLRRERAKQPNITYEKANGS